MARSSERKMIVAGRSACVLSLILCVSVALLGAVRAACVDDPSECYNCGACLGIVRSGDGNKAYYWVESGGSGECVQRYDPVGSSSQRTANMPGLCGKTVYVFCSSSVSQSCPVVKPTSGVSQLKLSSSLSVSFAALLALLVLAM